MPVGPHLATAESFGTLVKVVIVSQSELQKSYVVDDADFCKGFRLQSTKQ